MSVFGLVTWLLRVVSLGYAHCFLTPPFLSLLWVTSNSGKLKKRDPWGFFFREKKQKANWHVSSSECPVTEARAATNNSEPSQLTPIGEDYRPGFTID
jgi:hypothetical protein